MVRRAPSGDLSVLSLVLRVRRAGDLETWRHRWLLARGAKDQTVRPEQLRQLLRSATVAEWRRGRRALFCIFGFGRRGTLCSQSTTRRLTSESTRSCDRAVNDATLIRATLNKTIDGEFVSQNRGVRGARFSRSPPRPGKLPDAILPFRDELRSRGRASACKTHGRWRPSRLDHRAHVATGRASHVRDAQCEPAAVPENSRTHRRPLGRTRPCELVSLNRGVSGC